MKHASISVFVPHLACPNDCVFCNQKRIAGTEKPIADIDGFLAAAWEDLSDRFDEVDIAFFGGSFTGIEEPEMCRYLSAAARAREKYKKITGIRLSTRPDYISEHILDVLEEYRVTTVELGVQSMNDAVLAASRRGHTARDTEKAVELIKKRAFSLVLQFMPGMPKDTDETIFATAEKIIAMKPDGVRIYPCVVIKDTELEDLYLRGEFEPLSVEKAADICAVLIPRFEKEGIKVIRTGLHGSDLVKTQSVVAGPFHPAFGEIVYSKIYLAAALSLLEKALPKSDTVLYVTTGKTSQMTGQKRVNLEILNKKYGIRFSVSEDGALKEFEVRSESK